MHQEYHHSDCLHVPRGGSGICPALGNILPTAGKDVLFCGLTIGLLPRPRAVAALMCTLVVGVVAYEGAIIPVAAGIDGIAEAML